MDKVYLNGNHYHKLSGLYLTEDKSRISTWFDIPYLSSLYTAKLVGFSTKYDCDPSDVEITKSNVSEANVETGSTFYPIYEKISVDITDLDKVKGEIFGNTLELPYFSKENVVLNLDIENIELGQSEPLSIKLKDGSISTFIKQEPNKHSDPSYYNLKLLNESFKLSALLGYKDALSNWIDFDDPNISKFGIKSFEIDPLVREDVDENYRQIFGVTYTKASLPYYNEGQQDAVKNVFANVVATGKFTNAFTPVSPVTNVPLKSSTVFHRIGRFIEKYYNENVTPDLSVNYGQLTYNSTSNNRYSLTEVDNKCKEILENPNPNCCITKYEATIIPSKSGFYSFVAASDDGICITVDDKLILGTLFNTTSADIVSNLLTPMYNASNSILDKQQIRNLYANSSTHGQNMAHTTVITKTTGSEFYTTINSLRNNFLQNNIAGLYIYPNIDKYLESTNPGRLAGLLLNQDNPSASGSVRLISYYYVLGENIALLANKKYKLTIYQLDQAFLYDSSGKRTTFTDGTQCQVLMTYGGSLDGASELSTKKYGTANDTPYFSDIITWKKNGMSDSSFLKGYELAVPTTANLDLNPKSTDHKLRSLPIFCLSTITDSEKARLSAECYSSFMEGFPRASGVPYEINAYYSQLLLPGSVFSM